VLGIILFTLLAACAVFDTTHPWSDWTQTSDLRRSGYSERVRLDCLIRTPANTWSNLAYIAVGLYCIVLVRIDLDRIPHPSDGYLLATPVFGAFFGSGCILLGICSGFFHASLTRIAQHADVSAMFTPLLVLVGLNCGRLFPSVSIGTSQRPIATWPLWIMLVVITNILLCIYKWSFSSRTVLEILILLIGGFGFLDFIRQDFRFRISVFMKIRWLVVSGLLLAVAVVCRQLDVARRFTNPDSLIQGHALWHLFTAMALASMYWYYRHEERLSSDSV